MSLSIVSVFWGRGFPFSTHLWLRCSFCKCLQSYVSARSFYMRMPLLQVFVLFNAYTLYAFKLLCWWVQALATDLAIICYSHIWHELPQSYVSEKKKNISTIMQRQIWEDLGYKNNPLITMNIPVYLDLVIPPLFLRLFISCCSVFLLFCFSVTLIQVDHGLYHFKTKSTSPG